MLGGFTMISGAVDSVQGNVLHSPYLGGWDNVPLQSKLVELTGIPMRVESLSNAIALAETLFGSARGRKDVLCTTCALGLGTGLVLNGRLVAGHNFNAGVIGLMEVTTPAGVHDDAGSGRRRARACCSAFTATTWNFRANRRERRQEISSTPSSATGREIRPSPRS